MTNTIVDIEMEVICKLYGYMDNEALENWSYDAAKNVFDDEKKYCAANGTQFVLTDVETLYDTVKEMYLQDKVAI